MRCMAFLLGQIKILEDRLDGEREQRDATNDNMHMLAAARADERHKRAVAEHVSQAVQEGFRHLNPVLMDEIVDKAQGECRCAAGIAEGAGTGSVCPTCYSHFPHNAQHCRHCA